MSKNEVLQYCVPKGTTHLMMWFGSMLPEARYVGTWQEGTHTYEVGKDEKGGIYVNYVETLQKECKKMKEKGEACIFVYDSRLINSADEKQLKEITSSIPNCYFVDYKEFVEKVKQEPEIEYNKSDVKVGEFDDGIPIIQQFKKNKQSYFIQDIEKIIESNVKKQIFEYSLKKNSMANIVDCARMLLLHHPSKLKQLAIKSNCKKDVELNPDDCSLLYHDFDMIQQTQPDIQHTQNKQNLPVKKNIELDKNKPYLIFQKNIHGCTAWGLENSLILAISPNDKNERIDDIWCWYLNYVFSDDIPLYDIIGRETDEKVRPLIMDCNEYWKDEKHGSWKYKPRNPQHIVNRNTQNTENKQDINKNEENNEENSKNKNELNQEYINENKIDEKTTQTAKKTKEKTKQTKKPKNEQNDKTIKEVYIQSNSYEGHKKEDKKEEITNQPRRTIKHQQKLTNNKDCKKPLTFKQWLQKKNQQKKEEQKKTKKLCKEMIKYQYNLYHTIDSKRCIDVQNPYTNYKPVYADISNRTSLYNCNVSKGGKKHFPDKY